MPGICSSLITVCREEDLVGLEERVGTHVVMMSGPIEACNDLCQAMERHQMKDTSDYKRALSVVHTDSIAKGLKTLKKNINYIYVIVVMPEGEYAMVKAEGEIRAVDAGYLVKPSLEVVNWRVDSNASHEFRTPKKDILGLSSRFNVLVHSIFGNSGESVDALAEKLYSRLQHISVHPYVPM